MVVRTAILNRVLGQISLLANYLLTDNRRLHRNNMNSVPRFNYKYYILAQRLTESGFVIASASYNPGSISRTSNVTKTIKIKEFHYS